MGLRAQPYRVSRRTPPCRPAPCTVGFATKKYLLETMMLMSRVARQVRVVRVLKLIRRFLQAGIMSEGLVEQRTEGTPRESYTDRPAPDAEPHVR